MKCLNLSDKAMRHSVLNIVGTLMIALCQWLQVILITRVLGLYEVGVFTYFLAVMGPLVLLARFSLSILVPTQEKLNYSFQTFFYYRNVMNLVFVGAGVIVTLTLGLTIYEKLCLIIFIIFKYYETKEEFVYTENIALGHIQFLAQSKIYKSIVTTLMFVAAVIIFESLMAAVMSLFFSQFLVYLFYTGRYTTVNHKDRFSISRKQFKNIFILGIGLTLVEVLSSLMTNIPRFLIEHYFSMVELGIYGTLMYAATLTSNIIIAINQAVVSKLVNYRKENHRQFNVYLVKLFLILTVLIILGELVLITYGTQIFAFIYSDVFLEFNTEMILLAILLSFQVYSKVLEMIMSILNQYKIQVMMQGITFILIVVLSFILIAPYGITGALLAALITQVLHLLAQVIAVVYYNKERFEGG